MSTRRLIYFTASEHFAYRSDGAALALEERFSADDPGVGRFREYLRAMKGALFTVVADLAGEDFHEEQIPALRGSDRETVVQRRLAQRYRDTRLATAVPLGMGSGERRSERLLLASFTNAQQFTPWLDALAEAGVKLSGVYSVPLLAPALAQRLGARGGRALVVSANRAGLRQSYIDEGRLRFSRLESTVEMVPEALAMFVRSETLRLVQYLSTLRAVPREGPPIRAVVVAPAGERASFERVLVSDARLSFLTVDAADAARTIGLKGLPRETGSEALYLFLAAKRPPKEQFASQDDRRGFRLWQLQRGIQFAGAAGFTGCALVAGAQWLDLRAVQDLTEMQRRQARTATERYERITRTFPVTQTTTDNLKAAVGEFTRIARASASPQPVMVYVSKVLERFLEIEIESLSWRVGRIEGGTAPKPAAAAAGAASRSGPLRAEAELLEISGRVNATRRSDYRAITEQVERFADALRANAAYLIVSTRLPFDVTSAGTLTGDIGQTEGGEAPRFTIVLGRPFK